MSLNCRRPRLDWPRDASDGSHAGEARLTRNGMAMGGLNPFTYQQICAASRLRSHSSADTFVHVFEKAVGLLPEELLRFDPADDVEADPSAIFTVGQLLA